MSKQTVKILKPDVKYQSPNCGYGSFHPIECPICKRKLVKTLT